MLRQLTSLLLAVWVTAAGTAFAETRPLTLAEAKTLEVTTPVLHVVGGTPTAEWRSWIGAYSAWADYGDGKWEQIFTSGGEAAQEAVNGKPVVFDILLRAMPKAVRIGVTGYYSGPLYVDDIEMVLPDGTRMKPSRVAGVNSVAELANAVDADGKVATISHTAAATPSVPTVVDGVDAFFDNPPEKWRDAKLQLPTVPIAPPQFGVYNVTYPDTDPHEIVIGWHYTPKPADIAFYDFTVPQTNAPALYAEVRKINPKHKIVARLTWPNINPLDYAYDEKMRKQVADAITEQLGRGTDMLYGVYLGDEEPQHFFNGWYAGEMPDWVKRHKAEYDREVGKAFEWNSPDLRSWVIAKGPRLFNDIYDLVKATNPKLKVMPFLYVPGDTSGWGLWDLKQIKADGWVYQWYDSGPQRPVRIAVKHAAKEITAVWALDCWFNVAIQKMRERGIPDEDIICQTWAFQPTDDVIAQIENARKAGITNLFVFYSWAWVVPPPVQGTGCRDLAFKVWGADAKEPYLTQQTSEEFSGVGQGIAQGFVAGAAAMAKVAVRVKSDAADETYQVALFADQSGHPAGKPLATAPLSLAVKTDGWVEAPLAAATEVGKRYQLAIVPRTGPPAGARQGPRSLVDQSGGVQIAVSLHDAYSGGAMIHRELYPGYFDDWMTFDTASMVDGGASWAASYRQRQALERYIEWWRAKGGR